MDARRFGLIVGFSVIVTVSIVAPARADVACPDDQNFFTPFVCAEPDSIAKANGTVTRRGGELLLTTGAGTVTFSNRDQCGDDGRPFDSRNCEEYIFVRYSPENHGSLVLTGYYEGYDYRWVDDVSGRVTVLDEQPHFSPNGKSFVVVKATEAYGRNGIWIWAGKGPRLLWAYEPKEWALFSFVSWDGEDAIRLRVETDVQDKPVKSPARLVRTDDGWKREGPPSDDK